MLLPACMGNFVGTVDIPIASVSEPSHFGFSLFFLVSMTVIMMLESVTNIIKGTGPLYDQVFVGVENVWYLALTGSLLLVVHIYVGTFTKLCNQGWIY